jgi:hypothetical protein
MSYVYRSIVCVIYVVSMVDVQVDPGCRETRGRNVLAISLDRLHIEGS